MHREVDKTVDKTNGNPDCKVKLTLEDLKRGFIFDQKDEKGLIPVIKLKPDENYKLQT